MKNISCPLVVMSGRGSSAADGGTLFLGRLMSQGGGQVKFWGDSLQYSTTVVDESHFMIGRRYEVGYFRLKA